MSQDLIVSGDTYEGVERVAATNTKGGLVVYGDGDGEASSPTIAVAPIEGGYRITVTDVAGSRSFDMKNGLSPTINITETPFADANGAGSAIKIACVSKDPVTGEETESSETVYVRNGKNGLHGTDVTLDITRQSGDDPGWWFKKKQTVYNADGTTKVTETTDFIPVSDDFVIAKISGSFRDDTLEWEYTVLLGGLPAPAGGLNALVESGKIVIGVADGDLGFRFFADEAYNDSYVVPSGTVFNYNNGTFWFSNFADKDGEIKNMAFAIKAGYKDSPWWGMTYPSQYTIYLTGDQPGRIVECLGRKLEPREAYEILLDAANNDIPLLCYQKDAVFKLEDGSTHTPQYGTPFYYDHNTELLHCEHDGYACTLYIDLDVYKATAEKNTPYKTAESKADDLKAEDGTLMLLSAGEPIGEGVPFPTGDSNVFVADYDTTTFAEIKAAHDAGKVCFVKSDGMPFCQLLGIDDSEAIFIREINDTTDYKVTITSADGKDFTLVEKNISNVYVSGLFSAKYADIKAAYEAGKACFITYGALLCTMTVFDAEKAEFVGMLTPHIGMKGTLYADGTYNFQYVHSNAVQTVEQSLTEEKKAQARANIGALSTGDVDTVLQQAKDSGLFDGPAGPAGPAGPTGATGPQGPAGPTGATGKTAYAYAQDGGYTGTETEFAAKLASGSEPLKVTLSGNDTDGYTADKTVAEIYAARTAGRDVYMVGGAVTYQLSYLNSSFAAFSYTMASRNAIEIISVIMMSGVAPTRIHQTIDDSYVKYTAQSLDEEYKLQARTNIGAAAAADLSNYVTTNTAQTITGVKTFNAPANVAGTEQHTVKFKTSNGGAIIFGKEAANSGTMLRFDQVDGTTRLRFRGSATAGAIVWEQPEQGAQLYVDLGKQGVDKHRINFPSSGGTLALTSQIPSLSGYLPLSGGLMTGSLKFQAASLPGKSLQYVCGVDAFANGGEMGWQSKADFLSGYLTTTDTAAKATADANGNNIASTYANKNVGNTFNGEQKMINSTHCPTMNDIASGVGCSLKNARACDNQLIVAEIFAPTTTVTDSKINMSAVAGEIGFYHGGSGSGGQFSGKTQLARITSAGIYEGSTLLANKYLAKSGGTMTGALNLKNSTWNLAGDDAYFGDNDTAGSFAIKGANGTTNLKMVTYNGTTSGTLSWNGSNFAFSNALNFPGGTLTGNLTVGSAKIQTNGYVIGTWLQTTAGNASSSAMSKVCVQSPDGWIYTRTLDQLRNDMNAASKDEVVTAANGALKVTLSGNDTDGYTVDKTFAEIKTAWQAGRYVYVTNGVIVCNPCYFSASLAAVFSYTRATGDGVEVWSVMVNNLGTKPTVVKKTITA